jgi:hypothetical protein
VDKGAALKDRIDPLGRHDRFILVAEKIFFTGTERQRTVLLHCGDDRFVIVTCRASDQLIEVFLSVVRHKPRDLAIRIFVQLKSDGHFFTALNLRQRQYRIWQLRKAVKHKFHRNLEAGRARIM